MSNEDSLVRSNEDWLNHINIDTTQPSHKMFTSQSYFDALWSFAEHGLLLINEDGDIIDANPFMLDLIGTNLAEIQSKSISDIISPRYIKNDYTNISAIIEGKQYSYFRENELKWKYSHTDNIHVKIVALRVPSSLNYPFRHLIMQIYEQPKNHLINVDNQLHNSNQSSWQEIVKKLLLQKWFVTFIFVLIGFLITIISLTGHLGPLINKFFENK